MQGEVLNESAFHLDAELYQVSFDEQRNKTETRKNIDLIDLEQLSQKLGARDTLLVRQTPEFANKVEITLEGEVRFPGTYVVNDKESLIDVIKRAGGLTANAYPKGAVYTRVELKEQEEIRLLQLQDRLAENIAKAEISAAEGDENAPEVDELDRAQSLLTELKVAQAQGRLVIDLEKILRMEDASALTIQNEDRLIIPARKNSVTVIGEVQLPVSQLYEPGKGYESYINSSGGVTPDADESRIYIIKASGSVVLPEESSWFCRF